MADPKIAITATLASERFPGWVHDPTDKGGETVAGITRRDHPDWAGWQTVDRVKAQLGPTASAAAINAQMRSLPGLLGQVTDFYAASPYWQSLKLAQESDQATANKVFDMAVWMGVGAAKEAYQAIGGPV